MKLRKVSIYFLATVSYYNTSSITVLLTSYHPTDRINLLLISKIYWQKAYHAINMLVSVCLLGSNLYVHATPEKIRPSRQPIGT